MTHAGVAYTPEQDQKIRAFRQVGVKWKLIAEELGLDAGQVRQRGRRLGVCLEFPDRARAPASLTERDRAGAEPLPPMHPIAAAVLPKSSAVCAVCNDRGYIGEGCEIDACGACVARDEIDFQCRAGA
jgi:hypothetical protein